jgi:dipeptidyl aminopeptidase/acylaminoacyl peptidase
MSKVDDELTRRLQRAERPVDGNGLFEGLVARRSHRERLRQVRAGMVAFAVLAATAGGFVALRAAFDPDRTPPGETPSPEAGPANGVIVLSRPLPDGSQHLFAVTPGVVGERLITHGGAVVYQDPSVSPDGRTVAMTYSDPTFVAAGREGVIASVPIEGGAPRLLTEPFARVGDPSWSPDGSRIAFTAAATPGRFSGIYVMSADGSDVRLVVELDGANLSAPDWSPDGGTLVIVGLAVARSEAEVVNSDLYTVGIDGSSLSNLTETPTVSEWSPSWSPSGDSIAYHRNEGNISNGVRLIEPTGRPAGIVFDDADAGEIGEVDWSPDGRLIAFTSSLALTDTDIEGDLDVWTVRVDGTQLTNLTTGGALGISWQPVPIGSEPDPSPPSGPAESPIAPPEGRDIGLAFRVCEVDTLNADFDGDGTRDTAYVATRIEPEGCPASGLERVRFVGVDVDGDGQVDMSRGPLECAGWCLLFGTPDLDLDGRAELLVNEGHLVSPVSGRIGVYGIDGSTIRPISFPDGSNRIELEEVASVPTWEGAYCTFRGGRRVLSLWRTKAPTRTPYEYDITERIFVLDASSFAFTHIDSNSWIVTGELPLSGMNGHLCGVETAPL